MCCVWMMKRTGSSAGWLAAHQLRIYVSLKRIPEPVKEKPQNERVLLDAETASDRGGVFLGPQIDRVTYVDADLFFFSDPSVIFQNQPHCSVLYPEETSSFLPLSRKTRRGYRLSGKTIQGSSVSRGMRPG